MANPVANVIRFACLLISISAAAWTGCNRSGSPLEAEAGDASPSPPPNEPAPNEPAPNEPAPNKPESNTSDTSNAAPNVEVESFESKNAKPSIQTLSDPALLVERSIEWLESGDAVSAMAAARKAHSLAPEDPDVRFTLARCLAARQRFHEAVHVLDRLAADHPETSLPAMGQSAEWLVEMGQGDEAQRRYEALRQQLDAGSQSMVDRQLAMLFVRQGQRRKAAEVIRTLCRAGDVNLSELLLLLQVSYPLGEGLALSTTQEPLNNLGSAMSALGKRDWTAALEAVDRNNAAPEAIALRGRLIALQIGTASSKELEDWVSNDYPSVAELPDAKLAWAGHQLAIGQPKQAARACASVILADPTDHEAYQLFAQSLSALGRPDESERVAERARLIAQTQQIGKQVAAGEARAEQIATLSEILEQLGRPLEAIAWRAISASYQQAGGQLNREQALALFEELSQRRREWLDSGKTDASPETVLCGVDLSSLNEA